MARQTLGHVLRIALVHTYPVSTHRKSGTHNETLRRTRGAQGDERIQMYMQEIRIVTGSQNNKAIDFLMYQSRKCCNQNSDIDAPLSSAALRIDASTAARLSSLRNVSGYFPQTFGARTGRTRPTALQLSERKHKHEPCRERSCKEQKLQVNDHVHYNKYRQALREL